MDTRKYKGGDAMSPEEILEIVGKLKPLGPKAGAPSGANWDRRAAPPAPTRSGVGALRANPIMNPRAIVEDRVRQAEDGMFAGGKVRGCGIASKGHTKGKVR